MEAWRQFFPLAKIRPEQAVALDFLVTNIENGATDIFLEAPTGIGKSAIAIALANYRRSLGKRTYISTTMVSLEDQYIRDFHRVGLRQLHSKSKYLCPKWRNCSIGTEQGRCPGYDDDADLFESNVTDAYARLRGRSGCSYQIAKQNFDHAAVGIANSDFLLTCSRFVPFFKQRDLLIVDEAHTFADKISGQYSIALKIYETGSLPEEGEEYAWLEHWYLPRLEVTLRDLEYEANNTNKWLDLDHLDSLLRKIKRLTLIKANIAAILATPAEEWIFDIQSNRVTISPLWATRIAQPLISRLAPVRVYMSATLPCFERQARWLGVDPDASTTRTLALPSPFPADQRPIFYKPVVDLKHPISEETYQRLALEVNRLLAMHPVQRALVHISSYGQVQQLIYRCRNPRMITHTNSADRDAALAKMFETPGAVMVSPSMREGVDLFGDRSEVQIIAKLPFSSLGDKKVKRRMKADPEWYGLNTAQQLIQAVGRSVRSVEDHAVTYIIDSAWPGFYRRNRKHFPKYIQEAVHDYKVLEEMLANRR